MSGANAGPNLSRRQFLAGCGAVGAAATLPTARGASGRQADTRSSSFSPPLQALGAGGQISPEGQRAIADVDRRFQQQRPVIEQTVDAVKDIGLDPSGKTPINGQLGEALSGLSNARITFPSDGMFQLTEQITVQPDGPIEIAGNGCSFVIPAGKETKSFIFVLPAGSLISDITIDQSAKGVVQELGIQAESGVVYANNVTVKGYAPAKSNVGPTGNDPSVDAMFSPIARTQDSVVRVTNFKAVGGTAAGTHDEGDLPESAPENRLGAPMGVWVGRSNKGTIQLVNPTIGGWSNGIYGGRTTGRVEVRGGTFVNNFNAQTRLGGGSVVDGASGLLDDRQWSDKGPFKIGHQGVYFARVDAKHGNQTDPITFKNCKVVAKSMREGASLFEWESESGPGIIRNCHITNHLNRPVITGRSPSAPAATNILVDQSLIDGSSSASVTDIQNRSQSRIQHTCIQLSNAGSDDINGAQVGEGVSFGGKCISGSGLSKPKKVGSGGNLSSLPAPVTNGSFSATSGPYYDTFSSLKGKDISSKSGGLLSSFLTSIKRAVGGAFLIIISAILITLVTAALVFGGFAIFLYLVHRIFLK